MDFQIIAAGAVCLLAGLCLVSAAAYQLGQSSGARRAIQFAPSVDPWRMQADLMRASGQRMPEFPSLNETGVLYWALLLEEAAETGSAVATALHQAWLRSTLAGGPVNVQREHMIEVMLGASERMDTDSKAIRSYLASIGSFDVAMSLEEAVQVLDGTTDTQVVNSGFAIACGLPGADGYVEVAGSNLSKRFEDGTIHKDPSGKWLKGPAYRAPNLDGVLKRAFFGAPQRAV